MATTSKGKVMINLRVTRKIKAHESDYTCKKPEMVGV